MFVMCLYAVSLVLPTGDISLGYQKKFLKSHPSRVLNCMQVAKTAKKLNADIELAVAIASVETGFVSGLVSKAGARGLMGVMPSNMKGRPKTPESYLRRGVELMETVLDMRPRLCDALAIYNAGLKGTCKGIGGTYAAVVMRRYEKIGSKTECLYGC